MAEGDAGNHRPFSPASSTWPCGGRPSLESAFGASIPLRVVSLNLGCRNSNPLEFELKGDGSEVAVEAAALLRRANKALGSEEEGPRAMPAAELRLIEGILDEIYSDEGGSETRAHVQALFRHDTWEAVLAVVRTVNPHFFNALNLPSLELNRPSVLENSAACYQLSTTKEYLVSWKRWYCGLDPVGTFWLKDAPWAAAKRGMEVATAFAGLLVFDVMSLCIMRKAVSGTESAGEISTLNLEGRGVPFKDFAEFASKAPASCPSARCQVARQFVEGAHIVLAQEASDALLADLQEVTGPFLGPFRSTDGLSSVLLRRVAFREATDIGAEVAKKMEDLVDNVAEQEELRLAWRSTASRLAAAYGQCHRQVGGFTACAVSLHCSRQLQVAEFLMSLRDVLADYSADINIVGVSANCSSKAAAVLQQRLESAGFDVGRQPKQEQVTVAKRRTCFQTQVQKIGEDYIVSWAPATAAARARPRRRGTSYAPDLRSAYGVDQETKRCIFLPTTSWPFDHCGVATSFYPTPMYGCREAVAPDRKSLFSSALVVCMLALLLLPLVSSERENPYGHPGTWHRDGFPFKPLAGICEGALPCAEGWAFGGGSCYRATPRMTYADAQDACRAANGELVSISSEAENQFVTSLCAENEFCWIGLRTDHAGERSWWVSGERVDYNNIPETDATFFPFFPMTRASDYQVVVLSNLPAEIGRCGLEFHGPLFRIPLFFHLVNLSAPGVAMAVSGLFFLLPRPSQAWTTLYQAAALSVNALWFAGQMVDLCFAADIRTHRLVYTMQIMLDTGGHAMTSLISVFIILRRMRILYPCRALERTFYAMVAVSASLGVTALLFVDIAAGLNPFSVFVWAFLAHLLFIAGLVLVFAALVVSDLRQTWTFLQREAATGLSRLGGRTLAKEVLAARLHFLVVLTALVSGATRCLFALAVLFSFTQSGVSEVKWLGLCFLLSTVVDSITNDLCTYLLATVNMDGAVERARGISAEVAARAHAEVEQHRIAVRALKAAPTSAEQLSELARLETDARSASEEDSEPFVALQSAVSVESARIHRMMECVRLRAMTMPIRYRYLMDVPSLEGEPRQHVPAQFASRASPAAASEYFEWLYEEAEGARRALLQLVKELLENFNSTPWPTDLGLLREHFPWMIRASAFADLTGSRLSREEAVSPGDVLIHLPAKTILGRMLPQYFGALCFALEEPSSSSVRVHRSGMEFPEKVPREDLRTCAGGAVLVPGPKKKRQRCLDKIAADYEGRAPWPPAASLTDLCRCQVVLDDPYAMAVLVEYIRIKMRVVRLKNRFSGDGLESKSSEELQSAFSKASGSSDAHSSVSPTGYRDLSMNVEVSTPSGVPFICEIQVTLANLAILKHADQKLYTLRRMRSATELRTSHVFSKETPRTA